MQHGVIASAQLYALGLTPKAIKHRVATGRLFLLHRGVYAVGRPDLTQHGRWMAAVLACGPDAALSHGTAAALWGIRKPNGITETSAPAKRRRPGIVVHRRSDFTDDDVTTYRGIPVTTPAVTLIDLAASATRRQLEAAMTEADKFDLITPSMLQLTLARARQAARREAGMTDLLAEWTFTLTDSELERLFLPIARRAGLPTPQTQAEVNGFTVDFFFEELGIVVETDGGRFHRTAAQQTKDRIRDQTHLVAGLTPIRFTHHQIAYDADHVEAVLSGSSARRTAA